MVVSVMHKHKRTHYISLFLNFAQKIYINFNGNGCDYTYSTGVTVPCATLHNAYDNYYQMNIDSALWLYIVFGDFVLCF